MKGKFDSRHHLVGLSDELIRMAGRVRSLFADARREVGLSDSEIAVLNAVLEADRPPTVPQIGRSMGHPRQVVHRAAMSLIASGLVERRPTPDHKRAVLLVATPEGEQLKRQIDVRAEMIALETAGDLDERLVRDATAALRDVRKQMEARLRSKTTEIS